MFFHLEKIIGLPMPSSIYQISSLSKIIIKVKIRMHSVPVVFPVNVDESSLQTQLSLHPWAKFRLFQKLIPVSYFI